jgi:FKBP-type peptidyl-prolyl cis-trans isomerase FkpA
VQRTLSHIIFSFGALMGLIFLFSSCFDSTEDLFNSQLEEDIAIIDQYLIDHSIEAKRDPTQQIWYVIHTSGSGVMPSVDSSCVTVRFTGKFLTDDQSFTESAGTSYPLAGDLIEGWKLGIPLLKQGDSATLYIPSGLAYGRYGIEEEGIPADANVIFNIKLLVVGKTYSSIPSPTGSCVK